MINNTVCNSDVQETDKNYESEFIAVLINYWDRCEVRSTIAWNSCYFWVADFEFEQLYFEKLKFQSIADDADGVQTAHWELKRFKNSNDTFETHRLQCTPAIICPHVVMLSPVMSLMSFPIWCRVERTHFTFFVFIWKKTDEIFAKNQIRWNANSAMTVIARRLIKILFITCVEWK